jgi:histidine ammonia-lyase
VPTRHPVSYRVLPRVLGQAHRAVAQVEEAARISLPSATSNSLYLAPDKRYPPAQKTSIMATPVG